MNFAEVFVNQRVLAYMLSAALLLFVAAGIEGFWSASALPVSLKLAFGIAQFGIVGLWLLLAGEPRR